MRHLRSLFLALLLATGPAWAEPMLIADLSHPEQAGAWRFFTDRVMGGVSTGQAVIAGGALTLSGSVSTQNNGGFIQARLEDVRLPDDAQALRIRVRGDGQRYFLHLRTTATHLPWQYYQAGFIAPAAWTEIALPLDSFAPSGSALPATPVASRVRSIALVAYGRDHEANVSLAEIRAN